MVWKYLWSSSTATQQSKGGETVVTTEAVTEEGSETHRNTLVVLEEVKSSPVIAVDVVSSESQPPERKRRISIRQAISFSRSTGGQSTSGNQAAPDVPLPAEPQKDVSLGPDTADVSGEPKPPERKRRFSMQAMYPPRSAKPDPKPDPPTPARSQATSVEPKKEHFSRADRRAQKSAQRLQILITGDAGAAPLVSPIMAKSRVDKIKSQLSNPKSGNKVIAELRKLPFAGRDPKLCDVPIHAVCLEHPDAEEDALHFSKLHSSSVADIEAMSDSPVDRMAAVLKDMHVIDLVTAPDLGLGQPGDGKGLLAGAVPTPETVLNGVKQITPQLMALGYATGRMLTPDHKNIYPPTDRISVLTYWWGMELLLPPPTLKYLETAQSITGSVVNFLSAMALVNNGVREILPLVRYIAQFVDLEYKSIKAQDKGKGVVCAATWLMPAALVPRPWDFPDPPPVEDPSPAEVQSQQQPLSEDDAAKERNVRAARPISSMLDIVTPRSEMAETSVTITA